MKTLQLLDSYYPSYDGPTVVITNYAKCLNELGNPTEIMVPAYPNYEDIQPFKVNRVFSMPLPKVDTYRMPLPKMSRKAKAYFKESKIDIIHAHTPFTMAEFASKMSKKHNIPYVFTMHTKFRDEFNRILKSKFLTKYLTKYLMNRMKKAINAADYVVTVSDATIDVLRDYGYHGEVKVIRNGTDLTYPTNPNILIDKVNKAYNLDGQQNLFLFVGRIVETKKIQISLNALKMLKNDGVDFKMLIVGGGSYLNELKKLVTELDLDDRVIFTGKIFDREFLSGHFLRSDLFLFPSTFDTASLVPIEAAAMKLPTLLIKDSPTAETIVDDVSGYTAEENPEAFYNRIKEIIADKEKLAEVKEACYKMVYRTWEDVACEVSAYYQEILDSRKNKRLFSR